MKSPLTSKLKDSDKLSPNSYVGNLHLESKFSIQSTGGTMQNCYSEQIPINQQFHNLSSQKNENNKGI